MSLYNSIVVPAAIDQVWATVQPFHDMGWAEDVVERCRAVGEVPDGRPGAKRVVNDAFHETLATMEPGAHRYSYRIEQGPGPLAEGSVREVEATLALRPVTATGETFAEWSLAYVSDDDQAVHEFFNPIYQALLGQLRHHFAS